MGFNRSIWILAGYFSAHRTDDTGYVDVDQFDFRLYIIDLNLFFSVRLHNNDRLVPTVPHRLLIVDSIGK